MLTLNMPSAVIPPFTCALSLSVPFPQLLRTVLQVSTMREHPVKVNAHLLSVRVLDKEELLWNKYAATVLRYITCPVPSVVASLLHVTFKNTVRTNYG